MRFGRPEPKQPPEKAILKLIYEKTMITPAIQGSDGIQTQASTRKVEAIPVGELTATEVFELAEANLKVSGKFKEIIKKMIE